MFAYKVSPVI